MFNIVQMPETNANTYRIIKGQVSPAGYPVGAYDVIADDVAYDPARLNAGIEGGDMFAAFTNWHFEALLT